MLPDHWGKALLAALTPIILSNSDVQALLTAYVHYQLNNWPSKKSVFL